MTGITQCDLLVVGAGPAGLAAATLAARHGVDTMLLDEQPSPGGQIYRAITTTPLQNRETLGKDYWHGEALVKAFRRSHARYEPGATVWAVSRMTAQDSDRGFEVGYSVAGEARMLLARNIILATGAQERPFPIPGWTLPGVMTVGAAQTMFKTTGIVPGKRTVLAGCGPLLYLVAWQYMKAGVKIEALLDTTGAGGLTQALPHVWGFLRSPYLAKGLKLVHEVRAKARIIRGITALEAVGAGRLDHVRYTADGKSAELPCDQLLLHQGVIPNINLSQALGVDLRWSETMLCWEPAVDDWGNTNVAEVGIAGDGASITGALAAEHLGRLVALEACRQLGKIDQHTRDQEGETHRKALARAVLGRDFFDRLYLPPEQFRIPAGDTIVCRCEEVTAAQVRETVKLGCPGPNQMKSFLRCGMGPCQGRFCNTTVTEIIAQERGLAPQEIGHFRLRFPTKPLTLGELASLPQTEDSKKAVIRLKKQP